ncbi:hypothetical protein [Georgenia sp. SUBG003]|uniref:hypothetical protein n=1 Tax=Georgenia sp. SUBG003 TaxID=1497974 RepID=UPI003AB911D2
MGVVRDGGEVDEPAFRLRNVGLGSLSSTAKPTGLDYKGMFRTWMENAPEEWEFTPENQIGELRSAALPMAFNRKPHYSQGLLLVGDSGGMVSPFNGEGIAYAMQSGRIAADVVSQALSRSSGYALEKTLRTTQDSRGGARRAYYSLGQVFARLIERPEIMRLFGEQGRELRLQRHAARVGPGVRAPTPRRDRRPPA